MNGNKVCKHAGRTRWIFENDGKYPLLSLRRQGIFCATASNFGLTPTYAVACAHHFQSWYIFLSEGGKYI